MNLNSKQENGIVLQAEPYVLVTKPSEDDDPYVYVNNSLALIAKNFKKLWKKKNFNKPKKTSTLVAPMA